MDVKPMNKVLSFKKAHEAKSILILTSALSLLLFVVLPFFPITNQTILGFETFFIITGLEFWNEIGPEKYDLRWLVLLYQTLLFADVILAFFSLKIYNIKIFYLSNLTRHWSKLLLSLVLLGIGITAFGSFYFSSMILISLIAIVELIYDRVRLRKQVYERYTYQYPYRFMFFTTLITALFAVVPFIKKSGFTSAILPTDSSALITTFGGTVALVIVIAMVTAFILNYAIVAFNMVVSVFARSFVNKLASGFDFWRSLVMIIFVLPLVAMMYLFDSPLITTHALTVIFAISVMQLVVAINAKAARKKAQALYKKSLSEKPWIAKYAEDDISTVAILPAFVATVTLVLCFVKIMNFGTTTGYSIFDLVSPDKLAEMQSIAAISTSYRIVAMLTLIVFVSNLIFSLFGMFIKLHNLVNILRFSTVTAIALVVCVLFAASSFGVSVLPLVIMVVINAFMVGLYFIEHLVLTKSKAKVTA